MSIESLVGKIIDDTRRTAAEVEHKASEEIRAREEAAEKKIQQITEDARERANRSAAEHRQRMLSMAGLEGRKAVLAVKQQLIEEAFLRAIDKVVALDPKAYGAFVTDLILQADPVGDEEILLSERDRERLGDGWIERVNRRLVENKKRGEMRITPEIRSIRGGAILKRGRKEVNCSLESVILSKRNQMEAKVARMLFGDR
jgi:V/A-type H+-transporting ATPase subunit E